MLNRARSIIPDLIVSEVSAPSRIAPPNSVKIAIEQACQRVKDLEPTLVAKELATYEIKLKKYVIGTWSLIKILPMP